ncbi:MAG TPA: tripartite tricarboxylate transporter substrate binding protein [Burkholderiales bacterium]
MRRTIVRIAPAAAAVLLGLASACACAQTWPARPIRVIVPFPAGGTSDVLARALGQKLHETWGQPVIVDNRAGANGTIGAGIAVKSPPDGYTLLLTDVGALTISPSVFPGLAFDPSKDFAPVSMVSYSPHMFAVHPSVPAKTLAELIALAKAKPGQLNYATAGAGSPAHLAGVDFALRTGIQWTYIHYKGGGQATTDAVAGHAGVLVNGMLPVYPHVRSGRLRALAVSSAKRTTAAPDIPTVAETLPGFETGSWQGVLAPAGTSPEIINKLNAELRRILAMAPVRAQLAEQGTEVRADTPAALGNFIRAETARWAKVVKLSGVKVE